MGRYITQAPRVKKQQVFTVSGIFTPSPGLLATGGVVEVRCVGGGGGGGYGKVIGSTHERIVPTGGGGGSGADITRIVTVTIPVDVLIGTGGTGGTLELIKKPEGGSIHNKVYVEPTDGGDTIFGALVIAAGGKKPSHVTTLNGTHLNMGGGAAGGEGGFFGESGSIYDGGNGSISHQAGAGGGSGGSKYGKDALPNTGGGGGGGGAFGGHGGSGLCIVTWEE